ncbi:hypothetical protein B5S31_g2451 [[Candida] boidinii]|nr:hypothetical protein B5S31_g2451 [[Candida] boidinii]
MDETARQSDNVTPSSQDLTVQKSETDNSIDETTELKGEKKKRKRIILACSICRSKKIKCDRSKPICGSCKKSNIPQEYCVYQPVPWEKAGYFTKGNFVNTVESDSAAIGNSDLSKPSLIPGTNDLPRLNGSPPVNSSSPQSYTDTVGGNYISLKKPKISLPPIIRNSDANSSELDGLKLQLAGMKQMISKLEEQVVSGSSNYYYTPRSDSHVDYHKDSSSVDSNENNNSTKTGVLNLKFELLRPSCIFHKPTRTLFFGPYCFRTLFVLDFESLGRWNMYNDILGLERKKWKKKNRKKFTLYKSSLSQTFVFDQDNREISDFEDNMKLVVPEFEGVIERLKYFKDHLSLLFDFLDIDVVEEYFRDNFRKGDNGETIFIRPKKCSYYSDVSLVLGTLAFIDIFSVNLVFQYPLNDQDNLLYILSARALEIATYSRKQRLPVLQALLVQRLIQIYDTRECDGGDGTNSYYTFQQSLNIAHSLGLHRDPESIKNMIYKDVRIPLPISKRIWRKTWGHLKELDDHYCIVIGTPQLINDEFSDCSSDSVQEHIAEYSNLTRKVFKRLCSEISPLSINEVTGCLNSLLDFLVNKTEPFKSLLQRDFQYTPTEAEVDLMISKVNVKLGILETLLSIESALTSILLSTDFTDVENVSLTPVERQEIRSLGFYYKKEAYKLAVYSCSLIYVCIGSNNIYQGNTKYVLYLLPKLKSLIMRAQLTIFSISLHRAMKAPGEEIGKPISTLSIDNIPLSYEAALYKNSKFVSSDEFLRVDEILSDSIMSPKTNMAFSCEFCIKLINCPLLQNDYQFFVYQRIFLSFCCYSQEISKTSDINDENDFETRVKDRIKSIIGQSASTEEGPEKNILLDVLANRSLNDIHQWLSEDVTDCDFSSSLNQAFDEFSSLFDKPMDGLSHYTKS